MRCLIVALLFVLPAEGRAQKVEAPPAYKGPWSIQLHEKDRGWQSPQDAYKTVRDAHRVAQLITHRAKVPLDFDQYVIVPAFESGKTFDVLRAVVVDSKNETWLKYFDEVLAAHDKAWQGRIDLSKSWETADEESIDRAVEAVNAYNGKVRYYRQYWRRVFDRFPIVATIKKDAILAAQREVSPSLPAE